MSRGTVCGLIFFFKFWIVLDFLQKRLAWFSKFYLRVQSKNCGGNGFFCFSFQNFFRILSENFSDFWPKNFKKLSKLPSACADEQFLAWRNFQNFWAVLVFLQKPLAWFSEFYLRVQGKLSGRNSFLNFFFRTFSNFERNIFRLLAKKTSRSCQNWPLRVQTNNFRLEFFFKSFEPFWIFCRNLWHGSQTSIFVSRVKTPEELYLLFFFSYFFRILSEKFIRLLAKKLQEVFKTTLYVSRGTVCGLKLFFNFEQFWIFCRNLWHGPQNSI